MWKVGKVARKKEKSWSARARKMDETYILADEVEVYRKFGGCLPITLAWSNAYSLKQESNFLDRENKKVSQTAKRQVGPY